MLLIIFIVFLWLVFLQDRQNKIIFDLEETKKELKKEIDYYKTLIESIEYKLKHRPEKSTTESVPEINIEKHTSTNDISQYIESKTGEEIQQKLKKQIEVQQKIETNNTTVQSSFNDIQSPQSEAINNEVPTNQEDIKGSIEQQQIKDLQQSDKEHLAQQKPKEPISFVQLFSWIGGFILLLGVIFLIKYALEKELISATLRVAIGTIAGIALWTTGALLRKPNVKTTSDTLCACGLCTCYSVWFAAYYFYQMTSPTVTFILLSIIALASFATAVWKNAQYIGVLAQIIGFLTPFLFHTETPQIWFLLAYIGIINVAAVAAAIKRNWQNQLFTGLAFTFLCFLSVIKNSNLLQLAIFPAFLSIFYTVVYIYKDQKWLMKAVFAFTTIALIILGFHNFIFSLESSLEKLPYLITYAGFFAILFALLAFWKNDNETFICSIFFTLLGFVLIATTQSLIAIFIYIIFISLFFGVISIKNQNIYWQIASMFLTGIGFIALYFCQPNAILDTTHLPYLAGFATFFTLFFGIIAFIKKSDLLLSNTIILAFLCFGFIVPFKNQWYLIGLNTLFTLFFGTLSGIREKLYPQLTSIIFTAICVTLTSLIGIEKLHSILAFALIYQILYIFFSIKQKNGVIYSVNTLSLIIPLCIMTNQAIDDKRGEEIFIWLVIWNILIACIPFVWQKTFEKSKETWVSVSVFNLLVGSLIIAIFYDDIKYRQTSGYIPFLLFAFFAIYDYLIIKWSKLDEGIQKLRITTLITVPIAFLTMSIALNFTNEWKTIAYALEGFSLILLWHKLPINLLQNFGTILMWIVGIRLLLNPFIITYHKENNLFFNWYLYTYLPCSAAMFASAYFWRKDSQKKYPTILNSLGGILLFALVNIEIANYFSNGESLNFNFCGKVSEAATYTIAWAICGAVCMFLANKKLDKLLKVGIGLISLSVIKLFLFDIWQLTSLLRIIVLIGVAVIMLAISFIYQIKKKQ